MARNSGIDNPDTELKPEALGPLIASRVGPSHVPGVINIVLDTSNFTSIDFGDVLVLDKKPYLIRNNEREGRFGIDDQPKFWVKRAIDLESGETKIIKFVFRETFRIKVGDMIFECVRSPRKEARILDLVRSHPGFMSGFSSKDAAGNIIRVIDYIKGERFSDYVARLGGSHEDYFFNYLPGVMDDYLEAVRAILFLHEHGEKHGDIRRDHIIRAGESSRCMWIDFDFNYAHRENMFSFDLFGLGNVLGFIVGRGDLTPRMMQEDKMPVLDDLCPGDMNIVFNNRVMNLGKVYGYVPAALNRVLMHFSRGANSFYEETGHFLEDLMEAREHLP